MVSGASKRGWTTWSIAATDQRVVVMAPMVFSMINMDETVMRHFENMDGAWSFALASYYNENLTQEFFNPKTDDVWSVEDMYYYRERFTLPILEIVSSGDEFFLADDNWSWWNGIPDPKYLLMLPNAEHGMAPHYLKIYESAVSFWLSYLEGIPYPDVTWQMSQYEGGGSILLNSNPAPVSITAYVAQTLSNDTRRDFRLASLNDDDEPELHPVWWREDLAVLDLGNGNYRVNAQVVDGEWVGFYLMGTWEGPTGYRMIFTTQVNIVPDTRPHAACSDPESCWSVLV
jgi:PhoPQ-activated pathogenicity-related protein